MADNDKRKARFAAGPATEARNKVRAAQTLSNFLLRKLRKFERYVKAGKMTPQVFAKREERIKKEIAYCTGELKRPVPNYAPRIPKEEFSL